MPIGCIRNPRRSLALLLVHSTRKRHKGGYNFGYNHWALTAEKRDRLCVPHYERQITKHWLRPSRRNDDLMCMLTPIAPQPLNVGRLQTAFGGLSQPSGTIKGDL